MTRISREHYEDYVLNYVSATGEQWLLNGVPLLFTLEADDDYYYLTVDIQSVIDVDDDSDAVKEARQLVKDFGCYMCETLEEVNELIKGVLPDYCLFERDNEGYIWGY